VSRKPKIIGIVGYSGSGKTTLVTGLTKILSSNGLRVGTVKHTHHDLDILQQNSLAKDLSQSKIRELMVTNQTQFAIMRTEKAIGYNSPYCCDIDNTNCDIYLIEGFKHKAFPKIEVWRANTKSPILSAADPYILAIAAASNEHKKLYKSLSIPILDLNNHSIIAKFISEYFRLTD